VRHDGRQRMACGGAGSGMLVCTTRVAGDLAGGPVCEGAGRRKWATQEKRKVRKEKAMGQLGKKVGWFSFEDPTQEAQSLSIFLDYCKIKSNSNSNGF
jgi:hypothetical protein